LVDYLVPNERESKGLGRVEYRGTAIVTRGEKGALLLVPGAEGRRVPAFAAPVVDTTGAGDAFCGCFAASLAERQPLADALRRASAAGACAVTRAGAFAALPTRAEVERVVARPQASSESQS
jgi:ribokinase